jgi:hypothetical protein
MPNRTMWILFISAVYHWGSFESMAASEGPNRTDCILISSTVAAGGADGNDDGRLARRELQAEAAER